MLLTLYDSYGNVKAQIAPDESSTQDKEIQGDNLLKLSFTLYEFVPIDVNDYVDYGGERYWAVEKYAPAQKSTVEWEYSLQLYGIESLIKRFLVLNNTDGGNEAVFTLTGRPVDHVRLIVKNINDGMDGTTNFKAGAVEGTENVVIDYTGKYCHEALKELAEAVGTEWWFDGETLNLCRCEHGEEVALGYDKGLTALDRDMADGAKFYTRLFPIGSTRNIDPEKYGHSRLMLPDGAQYVDVNVEKYGIIHHYEQSAFAGIYPRRVGVVGSVRHEEVKDKDGKPFTIYYFRDNDLPFDPNDYEIGGLVKRVSFQAGSELAGLGTDNDHYFEVNFNSDTKEFEIITIWPYDDDTQLPGGTLVPKAGDKYILWNIRMPDEYYGLAEKELRSAVDEYNRRHALDVSRYKAPTDHVWMEETGTELFIGRRIRLESREYFTETGYRQSRITRISRKVNLPGQMDLEISDALSTGAMAKIDDAITDARNYAGTMVGAINVPDIIRSWDTTKPADTNLYSARRTHKEFLSKNSEDTAQKLITFLEGIALGKDGRYYLDGEGVAQLAQLMLGTFVKGSTGASIYPDAQGNWHIEGDYIDVRKKITAEEVEVMKSSHIRGKVINSPGSFIISGVEKIKGGWRCYFTQKDGEGRMVYNSMGMDDYAYCETFNLVNADGKLSNHYWHRRVFAVGADYVDICDNTDTDDYASGSDEPQVGDEVVTLGNKTNPERQSAIVQSAAGAGSPYFYIYRGIDSFQLPTPIFCFDRNRFEIHVYDNDRGDYVPLDSYLSSLRGTLDAVQEQQDRQMTIWFGDTIPITSAPPSSDWQDDATRQEHLHDIYYNKGYAKIGGGRAYSFERTDNGKGYWWREITDADVLTSLEAANRAQDTADGKRRVFVALPVPPYEEGDLWVNATYETDGIKYSNDLLRCRVRKAAGAPFSVSDWVPAQEVTSARFEAQIKAAGGELSATVKRLSDGLVAAGFVADGENSSFDIIADRFAIHNTAKERVLGVDADGNLFVRGNIEAETLKRKYKFVDLPIPPYGKYLNMSDDGESVVSTGRNMPDCDILVVRTIAPYQGMAIPTLWLPYAGDMPGKQMEIFAPLSFGTFGRFRIEATGTDGWLNNVPAATGHLAVEGSPIQDVTAGPDGWLVDGSGSRINVDGKDAMGAYYGTDGENPFSKLGLQDVKYIDVESSDDNNGIATVRLQTAETDGVWKWIILDYHNCKLTR